MEGLHTNTSTAMQFNVRNSEKRYNLLQMCLIVVICRIRKLFRVCSNQSGYFVRNMSIVYGNKLESVLENIEIDTVLIN